MNTHTISGYLSDDASKLLDEEFDVFYEGQPLSPKGFPEKIPEKTWDEQFDSMSLLDALF